MYQATTGAPGYYPTAPQTTARQTKSQDSPSPRLSLVSGLRAPGSGCGSHIPAFGPPRTGLRLSRVRSPLCVGCRVARVSRESRFSDTNSLLMDVKSQHHTHTLQTEASSPVRGGSHDGSTAANVLVVFSSRVDVRGGGHEVAERGSI